MAVNYKAFTDYVLKMVEEIEPGNPNVKWYEEKFKSMKAADFDKLFDDLLAERFYLPFFRVNLNEKPVPKEKWLDIADKIDCEVFCQLWQTDSTTGETFLTPHKYWVPLLPQRRQAQHLDSKDSIPVDNNVRDALTGQVVGASKGSSISDPQLGTMDARGFTANPLEFLKMRGGDLEASRAYNRAIIDTGSASIEAIMADKNTTPVAAQTLDSYLTAMLLANNFAGGSVNGSAKQGTAGMVY